MACLEAPWSIGAAPAAAVSLHCGAVTCLLPTRGDSASQLLFSAGADGAIFALRLDSERFLATLAAPLGETDDTLRAPTSPTRKEQAFGPGSAAPMPAFSEPVFSEVQCVPRAALAEREAALTEARARCAALQASSHAHPNPNPNPNHPDPDPNPLSLTLTH